MRRAPAAVLIAALGGATALSAQPASARGARSPAPPDREYVAYVASESVDRIARIVFGPGGARLDREVEVGVKLADPDGPHGLAVSPDARFYYVSTAHGLPDGYLWKFAADADTVVGRVTLGAFPASAQVSPDGKWVWVVNFNLHGPMVPSSVSVVDAERMLEAARLTTCTMPHGSRLTADGRRHYSVCMMDDLLVEADAHLLEVTRHFALTKGAERGMTGPPPRRGAAHTHHDAGGHGLAPPKPGDGSCSPTWAVPSPDGRRVWVACNTASDVVEIDVPTWTLVRRLPAGDGVYNLGVTHDGTTLVATNKRAQSVSLIDVATGRERARIPTTRRVVHGVAITRDDRYAFISVEGVGSEPGTVEVIDLRAGVKVASVDVGQQAGGIDVLP